MTKSFAYTIANDEFHNWRHIPEGLIGIVGSFDELKAKFSESGRFSEVFLSSTGKDSDLWWGWKNNKGLNVYSLRIKKDAPENKEDSRLTNLDQINVAYGCPDCENIIIGAPKIEVRSGSPKLMYTCGYCRANFIKWLD